MFSVSEKMASFKIHIDDENDNSEEKTRKSRNPTRTVLSTLPGNDLDRFVRKGLKSGDVQYAPNVAKPSSSSPSTRSSSTLSSRSISCLDTENLDKPAAVSKVEAKAAASAVRIPFKEKQLSNLEEPHVKNEEKAGSSIVEVPEAPAKACLAPPLDNSPMVVDLPPSANEAKSKQYFASCSLYFEDIYKYLRNFEATNGPKPCYMKRQPDVTYSMRSILVDWLVEVSEEFKLLSETLFLAVSFIDRFLSVMAVTRSRLQLLGTSALMIASKFEEIYPPEVGEFAYITDDTYSKKQVLRMEVLILQALKFELSRPTPFTFITILSSKLNITQKTMYLAMYITELTLLEADPYIDFSPSLIACAAIALARHCLRVDDVWPSSMERVTKYPFNHFSTVMKHLNETHEKSFDGPYKASREKYKSNKYLNVSLVQSRPLIMRDQD